MTSKLEQRLKEQRKRRRRTRWMIWSLLPILFLAAGALSYWWFSSAKLPAVRQTPKRTEETEHFIVPPNKLNIIVLGVDDRPKEDDPGRSDTLLVVTIDTVSREASVISVPRDTRVRVKGLGWDKINHAYLVGKVDLTRQTTENFLGIPMDYYAKVNLDSFARIVDAIGGITLDVEKKMYYRDSWDHYEIDLKPGVQRMDGRAALQYVRYRDEDGDIGRVARQQKFVRAVLAEVSTPAIILKAPSIIREVFASLDTDIPLGLMMGIARKLKDGLSGGLKTHMVEGLPYYIDDISYWVPDVMNIRRKVAETQGVPFAGAVEAAARRAADQYRNGFPANAHLDDGTYYPGMDKDIDKKKILKPGEKPLKPGEKPPAKGSVTIPGKSPVATPVKPGVTAPAKPPVKPAPTPVKPGPSTSQAPVRLAAELVNASGQSAASDLIAGVMQSRGFEVVGVSSLGSPIRTTVVTSYTQHPSVVSKLTGLPFKYVLNISEDSNRDVPVRVLIGQDYGG
jgi:LCP family protein required for cell wall assembly